MKTTVEFLAAVKARKSITSDYALALVLGITRQAVSRLQKGDDYLGDSTAISVANLLDLDPAYVIACAHAERAKKDEEKAVWESIIQRLGGLAAALALGLGLAGSPAPAEASPAAGQSEFVLCKTRRRRTTFTYRPFCLA